MKGGAGRDDASAAKRDGTHAPVPRDGLTVFVAIWLFLFFVVVFFTKRSAVNCRMQVEQVSDP